MPEYDGRQFSPPAPVAVVTLRSPDGANSIADVAMQIDSGSDLTLIPASCVELLALRSELEEDCLLKGFNGSTEPANVVRAEMLFLGRSFRGRFPLIHADIGILGRNVLNHLSLVLDGPQLNWREGAH